MTLTKLSRRGKRPPLDRVPIPAPAPVTDLETDEFIRRQESLNGSRAEQFSEELDRKPRGKTPEQKLEDMGLVSKRIGHADAAVSLETNQEIEIDLDQCHPHPENRHSADGEPELLELALSIKDDGLLQSITVRVPPAHWGLPKGHVQIVMGERRWRACRIAGRGSVLAKVRELDDATTRRLMAIENAKRKNLTPIDKAKQVVILCSPNQDGSPPLTRQQAAEVLGLENHGSASNLVRLLELPKVWLDRIAAGELAESWGRILLRANVPKLLDQVNASWERKEKGKNLSWQDEEAWETRDGFTKFIESVIEDFSRPVEKDDVFGYGYQFWERSKVDYDTRSALQAEHPLLFEITPELEKKLEIVELELPSDHRGTPPRTVRRATNWKLYDQHQIPALKAHVASKAKKKAEKSGRDKPAPKRELTPAERKKLAIRQLEQLGERVEGWRHTLLLRACSRQIGAGEDSGLRIVLAYACHNSNDFEGLLKKSLGMKSSTYGELWSLVGPIDELAAPKAIAEQALQILALSSNDPRFPELDFELINGYAVALKIDLAEEWKYLQACRGESPDPMFEQFFSLHQSEQLRNLADELGVHLPPSVKTRPQMVHMLANWPQATRRLALPKIIKPVAGQKKPAKSKAKK